MKTKLLCLSTVLTVAIGFSQNTFPTGVGTNVGIGTITPTEKLEVIGTVKAETGIFYREVPNGATFLNVQQRALQCNVLSAGTMLDPTWNYRTFQFWDFPKSNIDNESTISLTLTDRSYKTRFDFTASQNDYTHLVINNKNQHEIFKVGDYGNGIWLQMPQLDSRLVIGDYANYLPQHKLVVRAGSAKIEGDILTDSNIGIGTSNFTDGADTYRLSVSGAIRAHRVRVYTNWADYVFEESYKLPTLQQVEEHINEKGHLINIPSAKEVEEKGIDLGEMNKLLLEKIEEMTLYMIEMNKEIQNLKEELKTK
jgi:hypothetical protein